MGDTASPRASTSVRGGEGSYDELLRSLPEEEILKMVPFLEIDISALPPGQDQFPLADLLHLDAIARGNPPRAILHTQEISFPPIPRSSLRSRDEIVERNLYSCDSQVDLVEDHELIDRTNFDAILAWAIDVARQQSLLEEHEEEPTLSQDFVPPYLSFDGAQLSQTADYLETIPRQCFDNPPLYTPNSSFVAPRYSMLPEPASFPSTAYFMTIMNPTNLLDVSMCAAYHNQCLACPPPECGCCRPLQLNSGYELCNLESPLLARTVARSMKGVYFDL